MRQSGEDREPFVESTAMDTAVQTRAILEAMPDMVFRLSRDGTHVDFYAPSSEALYVRPEHIIGKTVSELLPADVAHEYMQSIDRVFNMKTMQVFEYTLDYPEGDRRFFEARMVPCGENHTLAVVQNITDRRRVQDALRTLVETSSHQFGDSFFESMTLGLAKSLAADYTFVGELLGDGREVIRTVAAVADGQLAGGFEYDLKDTPCEQVVGQRVCSYPSNVAASFPNDKLLLEMDVEGYVGVPLFDSSGGALGLLVALYRNPIENVSFAESILQIFSARVGSEIERQQAEDALRKNEERLDLAMSVNHDGMYDWDVPTGKVYFDPRYYTMAGYEPDEFPGTYDNWAQRVHPEDFPQTEKAVKAFLAGELTDYDEEFRFRRKDGDWMWIRARVKVVKRDDDGEPLRMIGTHTDITERKHAEIRLLESQQQLRDEKALADAIIESLPGQFYVFNEQGRYVRWNKSERASHGASDEDMPNLDYLDQIVEADRAATKQAFDDAFRRGHAQVEHQGMNKALGETRTYFATGVRTEFNSVPYLIGIALDITERKRAEEALRESEARFRNLFENAPDANLLIIDGTVIDCNQAAMTMLGANREQIIGKSPVDLSPEYQPDGSRSAEKAEAHIRKAVEQGGTRFEWVHQRMDGTEFWVEVAVTAMTYQRQHAFFAVLRDITDRKRAEQERQELEAQLRQSQKMEAVGRLAGGVAHDFNNVLTAILGNTELAVGELKSAFPGARTALEGLDQITESAQRASSLTRQLLTFSRKNVVRPAVLNLNNVLVNLDRMLRRLIAEDIALETVPDAGLKSVLADAGQIEQVIVNLVVNAADAMPRGGNLTIETQNVVLEADYVANHTEAHAGPHVLLAVSDTGIGMDAAMCERIFEPFFTTKDMDKGTGLGLATVHGIVKQAGGHIMVYSEPGRGSTFKVYLPTVEAEADDRKEDGTVDAGCRESATILLCEDDQRVRKLIAQLLGSAGHKVIPAGTTQECIDAAEAHAGPVDLLITDVIMPDMNGRALSDRLRLVFPDLPTLFISGYTSNVIVHHGVLDGDVEFLEKPFSRQALLDKVGAVLGKKKS